MNRSLWMSACAVLAVAVISLLAVGQEAVDTIEESLPASPQVQPADPANATSDFCQCIGAANSASIAKIEQALRGQLESGGLDFTETPLKEVVAFIEESYAIPVQLDLVSLEEEGVDPQEPVTANLHGISLRSALELMLKQLGLTYIIQHEVLMITSPTQAEFELTTCVYDVRDLIDGPTDVDGVAALIDAIANAIPTEGYVCVYSGNTNEGAIKSLKPGLLVISETQAAHEHIRGLLEAIRNVRNAPSN